VDVFGLRQRVQGVPEILSNKNLPSVRRQGESACAALQSENIHTKPQEKKRISFTSVFRAHHPEPTTDADLRYVNAPCAFDPVLPESPCQCPSIWDHPTLLHGESFDLTRWQELYPVRNHAEIVNGELWSFFAEGGRHIVSAAKESVMDRPHGHVLYGSGKWLPDSRAVGTTVYAPGIFQAQFYEGNPNLARLLTVVRDPLQRLRGPGQRVWINTGAGWVLLGSPSAFEMGKNHALWLYQHHGRLLEIVVNVDVGSPSVSLSCRVREGEPVKWRITHQVALGSNELESGGCVEINDEQDVLHFRYDPNSIAARYGSTSGFTLCGLPGDDLVRIGSDELVWLDGNSRGAPYAVLESRETIQFAVRISTGEQTVSEEVQRQTALPSSSWHIADGHADIGSLAGILPWFRHDAWIHLASPHGLEQYGGAAWGVRDVCQGPVEWLITEQRYGEIREILKVIFSHQYRETGMWPQWFMLGPYADIQQKHCHGDIMFWPLKALCDYAEAANDPGILDLELPFTEMKSCRFSGIAIPLSEHVERVVENYRNLCIPGTALVAYGEGDWDDTLQPVNDEMRRGMVSAWTVELAYQVFGQLAGLYRRSGRERAACDLDTLREEIRSDFMKYLMPDGIVAGFGIFRNGSADPLLHPRDKNSGIQYRLLPMTRGVISGMFDAGKAQFHRQLIREHLKFPDGVRLMNRPVSYNGGRSRMFQRAETAAYFGREVSLQYVHAHLRYAEAAARMGDSDELWWALQVVNPIGLNGRLPIAAPRQANVYFSSSDADVLDRYEAEKRYDEMRNGRISVKTGWRLYSSGPGLFLHKVRNCLFGIRECYDQIIFDPVLPGHLLPCAIRLQHEGKEVVVHYERGSSRSIAINGQPIDTSSPTDNPYRAGGLSVNRQQYRESLNRDKNHVTVTIVR
jgi:CRISPR-associated protein Csx3